PAHEVARSRRLLRGGLPIAPATRHRPRPPIDPPLQDAPEPALGGGVARKVIQRGFMQRGCVRRRRGHRRTMPRVAASDTDCLTPIATTANYGGFLWTCPGWSRAGDPLENHIKGCKPYDFRSAAELRPCRPRFRAGRRRLVVDGGRATI